MFSMTALIFGSYGPPLAATTTTIHQPFPTSTKIKHSCSISVLVGFLWLPLPTTTEIEHLSSFLGVVGFLWLPPLSLPQLLTLSLHVSSTCRFLYPSKASQISTTLPNCQIEHVDLVLLFNDTYL